METLRNGRNDPNAGKNRVPTATELKTLKNLAQSNHQMIQDLEERIEEKQKTQTALQHRYEKLMELVEGAESEIVATERSLRMLEAQKALVQADQKEIEALIHPIRRCPPDVLRLIFECTVEIDGWLPCATRLSQVCRHWRNVAVSTASIWTSIHVSLSRKPEDISVFWSRIVGRVRAAPITIVIKVDGTSDVHSKALSNCRFDLLPHIEHLLFEIWTKEAPTLLASSSLRLPTGQVDRLELESRGVTALSVDALAVANQFPATPSLLLCTISQIRFSPGLNSTVIIIHVTNVESVSLQSLGQAFPSVQDVTFHRVKFTPSDTGDLIWPKLQQLTISSCDNFQWEYLAATDITSLSSYDAVNQDMIAFIASHKSLESLDVEYSQDLIQSISVNSPQLLRLTIDNCEEIADRTSVKLSKLNYLGVYDFCMRDDPLRSSYLTR